MASTTPFSDALVARYQDWTALRINLLWIYEGTVPPDGRGTYRKENKLDSLSTIMALEYCAAWLILEGEASVTYDGETVRARAGEWLVPYPELREQHFSPDIRILSIRFQAHWPDKRALFDDGLSKVFASAQVPAMEEAVRRLLGVVAPHQSVQDWRLLGAVDFSLPAFLDIKIEMLRFVQTFFRTLVDMGLKPTRLGTRDERILQALSQLDRLPLHHKLLETELASEVGLGLSQFVRLFRAQVGMTPKRYFEQRRCEAARRMLLHSSLPIKQLAGEFGFAHHTDFSAWFKRIHEVSPKAFRERFPL